MTTMPTVDAPTRRARGIELLISPLMPLLLLVIGVLLIRPWGNFPMNDDWQYAHIADHFAKTGEIRIDRPIAPTLIVQTFVGGAIVRLFGVSHVALRFFTFALFLIGLIVVDRVLARVGVRGWARAVTLLAIGFNPIGLATGLSFMTEVYGTLPALLSMFIWCSAKEGEAPSLRRATVAILFGCAAYLSRQFSGLIVPAMIGSLFLLKLRGRVTARWSYLWFLAAFGMGLLASVAATHWLWARATLNEPEELHKPLGTLLAWKGAAWSMMGGFAIAYLTAFVAPLLLLLPRPSWRRLVINMLLLALAIITFKFGVAKYYKRHPGLNKTVSLHMPFLSNVIGHQGVGPLTTTDVYVEQHPLAPRTPKVLWPTVEYCLYALLLLWALVECALLRLSELSTPRLTVFLTGALFAIFTLAAALQTYGFDFFDRYLWSPFIGGTLALACLTTLGTPSRRRRVVAGLLLAPIIAFSIAGLHDNFLFQRVRWSLYRMLLDRGISPLSIDGGYEPNGWYAYDMAKRGETSASCVAACKCRAKAAWFCVDDSYRIATVQRGGDIVLERLTMRFWLLRQSSLLISRRPDP